MVSLCVIYLALQWTSPTFDPGMSPNVMRAYLFECLICSFSYVCIACVYACVYASVLICPEIRRVTETSVVAQKYIIHHHRLSKIQYSLFSSSVSAETDELKKCEDAEDAQFLQSFP